MPGRGSAFRHLHIPDETSDSNHSSIVTARFSFLQINLYTTVYVQMRCWAERGVLAAVFERLRDPGSGRLGHRDSDAGQHLGEGACGWDG